MALPTNLLIPYGLAADGRLIHIADVPRGLACNATCPNCKAALVARKGRIKQHHFAHASDPGGRCTPESYLHAAAKILLASRFNAGAAVPFAVPCRQCPENHLYYVGGPGTVAMIEAVIPERNIRPDITVGNPIHRQAAAYAEIVVTHPPEYDPDTLGAPALIIPVATLETLEIIKSGTIEASIYPESANPCPDPVCPICGSKATQGCRRCPECGNHTQYPDACLTHHFHRSIKLDAWNDLARMRHPQPNHQPLQDWHTDKYGNTMFGRTLSKVHSNARELLARGFVQHNPDKPWSFRYPVPDGYIYAHLGGTDDIPIWEDQTPMMHEYYSRQPRSWQENLYRDAVAKVAYYTLERSPAGVRVSFYNRRDYDITAPLADAQTYSEFGIYVD